jgi:hypothetical protein
MPAIERMFRSRRAGEASATATLDALPWRGYSFASRQCSASAAA